MSPIVLVDLRHKAAFPDAAASSPVFLSIIGIILICHQGAVFTEKHVNPIGNKKARSELCENWGDITYTSRVPKRPAWPALQNARPETKQGLKIAWGLGCLSCRSLVGSLKQMAQPTGVTSPSRVAPDLISKGALGPAVGSVLDGRACVSSPASTWRDVQT